MPQPAVAVLFGIWRHSVVLTARYLHTDLAAHVVSHDTRPAFVNKPFLTRRISLSNSDPVQRGGEDDVTVAISLQTTSCSSKVETAIYAIEISSISYSNLFFQSAPAKRPPRNNNIELHYFKCMGQLRRSKGVSRALKQSFKSTSPAPPAHPAFFAASDAKLCCRKSRCELHHLRSLIRLPPRRWIHTLLQAPSQPARTPDSPSSCCLMMLRGPRPSRHSLHIACTPRPRAGE
jgi:hypothetical protein